MTTAAAHPEVQAPQLADRWLQDVMARLTPAGYAVAATEGEPPHARFIAWPYIELISERIARAVARGAGRLIINLPPRHGKSTLISKWTPTWHVDNWPEKRVILASYGAQLAVHWGREVRNTLTGNRFCRSELRQDSKAADRWNTPDGGGMLCAGVGGPVTGFGGDLIIIDDPHKDWAEAYSQVKRDAVWDWFNGTLYTRLEPGGTIVLLMTRWHPDDLTGRLLKEHHDEWEVIKLPAMATSADDLLGRVIGEALCPPRYPVERLREIARDEITFEAEYQQNPLGLVNGRVWDRYDEDRNLDSDLELDPALPLDLSIDFNLNPGMHLIIGQHRRTKGGETEIAALDEIHDQGLTVQGAMLRFEKWLDEHAYDARGKFRFPHLEVFGDPAGRQRMMTTGRSSYDLIRAHLRRLGLQVRMRVPEKQSHVIERMHALNDALCDGGGEAHYRVHPRCKRLITDFCELPRDEDGLISKDDEKLSHASEAEANRVLRLRPAGKRAPRAVCATSRADMT